MVLIPDGDPHATGGSSGVAFLDGSFARPVPLDRVIAFGRTLIGLGSLAEGWRSSYLSPDWPDYRAPYPIITGRATVTRFDASSQAPASPTLPTVRALHAESDATNQVAQSVTVILQGPVEQLAGLSGRLSTLLPSPFELRIGAPTSLKIPPDALALSVVGTSSHAGYPHRGRNPVPATLELLSQALHDRLVDTTVPLTATFGVDLRLPPEMPLDVGVAAALESVERWATEHDRDARIVAPADRARGGYALAPDHPALLKMERILGAVFGAHGVYGEYGGTDASSLLGVRTPRDEPIPALVFGLMGRTSHIHEAEENVDPRGVAQVTETICRFVREA